MGNSHFGFALDVAVHLVESGLDASFGDRLLLQTVSAVEQRRRAARRPVMALLKTCLPKALHPLVRKAFAAIRSRG